MISPRNIFVVYSMVSAPFLSNLWYSRLHALYICWIHFTWYINLRCPYLALQCILCLTRQAKKLLHAANIIILWPHELVSLVSLSFNIGHAWRPLAPPPVSFRVCAGRNFERADFTEHLQEHPVGNEQCWGLEIHQECHSPWRPSSRRLPAVRWSINNQLSKFIVETRKTNGAQYQPATLHSLLCGIFIDVYYYMCELNPVGCPCKLPWKERHQIPEHFAVHYRLLL